MMKDPLQNTRLPHEILKLDAECRDPKLIRFALAKETPRREYDFATLKSAHDALLDPVRRLEPQILLYHSRAFEAITPSPFEAQDALALPNRAETAKRWEEQFRAQPTNAWLAQSLAVLWYWWAAHEQTQLENEIKADVTHDASSLDVRRQRLDLVHEYWKSVIGYSASLIATESFWKTLAPQEEALMPTVRDKFASQLRNKLRELGHGSLVQTVGDDILISQFRKLEHIFNTEVESAKEVGELGRGVLSCGNAGPVLLRQVGLIEEVCNQIQHKSLSNKRKIKAISDSLVENETNTELGLKLTQARQESSQLKQLSRLISDYRAVETLLVNSPQEAIGILEALPEEEKDSNMVAVLLAKARHAQATHLADLGKYLEALEVWAVARKHRRERLTDTQMQVGIRTMCLTASSQYTNQIDKAIDILERGLSLLNDDAELKETLALQLVRRAENNINKFYQQHADPFGQRGKPLDELISIYEQAIADHERAGALGSAESKGYIEKHQQTIGDLRGSPEFVSGTNLIDRAFEKANKSQQMTPEIRREIEEGLAFLDKAAALGSRRAQAEANSVRQVLNQIKAATNQPAPSLATATALPRNRSAEKDAFVTLANEAAERGDWEMAVDLLEMAKPYCSSDQLAQINQWQANCRANLNAQRGYTSTNTRSSQKLQKTMATIIGLIIIWIVIPSAGGFISQWSKGTFATGFFVTIFLIYPSLVGLLSALASFAQNANRR